MTTELVLSDKEQRRFWAKVALPDGNGCMLWMGALNSRKYGHGKFAGAFRTAHRVSLHLADGAPAADDLQTAHACRNRHCVAPDHLRWATQSENQADRWRDGTHAGGERAVNAKLTDKQAEDIRAEYAAGRTSHRKLAYKYGVSKDAIRKVVNRLRYSPKVGA